MFGYWVYHLRHYWCLDWDPVLSARTLLLIYPSSFYYLREIGREVCIRPRHQTISCYYVISPLCSTFPSFAVEALHVLILWSRRTLPVLMLFAASLPQLVKLVIVGGGCNCFTFRSSHAYWNITLFSPGVGFSLQFLIAPTLLAFVLLSHLKHYNQHWSHQYELWKNITWRACLLLQSILNLIRDII